MSWQYEPYSFKKKRIGFWNSYYELYFEETCIRTVADRETIEEVVPLLNAAWNLGYAQGSMGGLDKALFAA